MLFTLELSLPRDARFVSLLRNVACCVFENLGAPQEAVDDIGLALSEACANAVRHAVGSNDYSVRFTVDAVGCTVEVKDLGPGFPFPTEDEIGAIAPDGETEAGRGFILMQALVDDLKFTRHEGTSVTLRKYWPDVGLALARESSGSPGG